MKTLNEFFLVLVGLTIGILVLCAIRSVVDHDARMVRAAREAGDGVVRLTVDRVAFVSTKPGPDGWCPPTMCTDKAEDDDMVATTARRISLAVRMAYSNGYERAFADMREAAKGASK